MITTAAFAASTPPSSGVISPNLNACNPGSEYVVQTNDGQVRIPQTATGWKTWTTN